MKRLVAIGAVLAACGPAHPPDVHASRTTLPADGESRAEVIVSSAARPDVKIRSRRLHLEGISGASGNWRVTLRAGVMPGRATVDVGRAVDFELTPLPDEEDALRLDSDADREAFRRWFTFLAEAQYFRAPLPPEITDCAALIRYAYREALREHDTAWTASLALPFVPSMPGVEKYQYPYTPLEANLFRVSGGGLAQFADAQTLMRFNTRFVTKDIKRALPGDMLFFRQSEQRMPFHTMIFVGPSQVDRSAGPWLVYHTGEMPGEVRRVTVDELKRNHEPRWHPFPANENFLGVYRWNIL